MKYVVVFNPKFTNLFFNIILVIYYLKCRNRAFLQEFKLHHQYLLKYLKKSLSKITHSSN